MYSNVTICVQVDYSTNELGLMQGEVLFLYFFLLYVNDCEMAFINSSSILLEVKDFYLFLLMYADDMVIFFLSPFQGCKICLMLYMNIHLNGHLSVNTSKTKIVVFRNGGKIEC